MQVNGIEVEAPHSVRIDGNAVVITFEDRDGNIPAKLTLTLAEAHYFATELMELSTW